MPLSVEDQKKLIGAQVTISQSLSGINDTLCKLNDHNILHAQSTTSEHNSLMDKITVLTAKYWWLLMVLIFALIVLAGAEKVLEFIGG